MAFDSDGWILIAQGGTADSKVKRIYSYTTADADSVVGGDGYFDDVPGDPLQVGDMILASNNVDGTPVGRVYIVSVGGADVTAISVAVA